MQEQIWKPNLKLNRAHENSDGNPTIATGEREVGLGDRTKGLANTEGHKRTESLRYTYTPTSNHILTDMKPVTW